MSKRTCNTPTAELTDEEINDDMVRAADAGSKILGLAKCVTDCPTCTELAIIMALASIMDYNESRPKNVTGLIEALMKQKSLMDAIFTNARMTAIPIESLTDVMTPRDPKNIQ